MYAPFRKVLTTYHATYRAWDPLYSPALDEMIHFTAKGFNHLRFHADGSGRNEGDTFRRLRLLTYVPEVIRKAESIEEHRVPKSFARSKVQYWSLVGVIDEKEIRVILRKVAEGKIHFWSVMERKNPAPK